MSADSVTVLDVSRLLSRTKRGTPTGIDRVELDEVERLLSCDHQAAFFATRGKHSWFLDVDVIARIAAELRRRWEHGTDRGWSTAKQVFSDLGARPDEVEERRRIVGNAQLAELKFSSGRSIQSQRYSRKWERLLKDPARRVTYRNVSHHHLEKPEFLQSLKARWRAEIEVYWHDAIPITWPEYSREGDAAKHLKRLTSVISSADCIEVNSETTKAELLELAGDAPPKNVIVRPLQSALVHSSAEPIQTKRPYFICVGTIEPRKNHALLLQVWRSLATTLGTNCPALVLAGQRGWLNEQTFAMIDRCPGLQGNVLEAPDLPDAILAPLISGAEALLMPSFAEGFGLPIIEAEAFNTTVIASDLAVFREVASRPFVALSPIAGEDWRNAILAQLAHRVGSEIASERQP
ncbi:MAG: glycosyltransferase family 4 protein [Parvularculaceae bacterium]|nr:glycosyltransferase family 4 protein [Parvularculaceae bacterium]